jgi:inactive STAND
MGITEKKYRFYQSQLTQLDTQLFKVQDDLKSAPTSEVRSQLMARAESILEESEKIEDLINQYEAETVSSEFQSNNTSLSCEEFNYIVTQWEKDLHHIDYRQAKNSTSKILKKIQKNESRTSLFLFQNYQRFAGRRYVNYLESAINNANIGRFHKLRRIELSIGELRGLDFLLNLSGHLDLKLLPSQISVDLILDKIEEMLGGHNIFLMEVSLPNLNGDTSFICWFIDEFWNRIHDRMPQFLAQNSKATFICVMTLASDLEKKYLESRKCTPECFDSGKFVVLQREKWRKDKIQEWMNLYARPPLSSDQIKEIHGIVWDVAEGVPYGTECRLFEELKRLAG